MENPLKPTVIPACYVLVAETHPRGYTCCCSDTYLGDQHGRNSQPNVVGGVSVAQPFHVDQADARRALGSTTHGGPRELAQREHDLRQIDAACAGLRSRRHSENPVPARQSVHEEGLAASTWAEDRHKVHRPRRERVCHHGRVRVGDHRPPPRSATGPRHPFGGQVRKRTFVDSGWFFHRCRPPRPPRRSVSPVT